MNETTKVGKVLKDLDMLKPLTPEADDKLMPLVPECEDHCYCPKCQKL